MIKEKDKHKYPAIPLRNTTVFPGMVVHFDVSRKKSVKAVETAMSTDQYIYLVTQLDSQVNEPELRDLYSVGTIAQIKQIIKMPGRILRVQVEGIDRAEINSFEQEAGIMVAEVTGIAAMQKPDMVLGRAILVGMKELLKQYAQVNPKFAKDTVKRWLDYRDAEPLLSEFAAEFPMEYDKRQKFLEMADYEEMYTFAATILINETNAYRIKEELGNIVREKVEKNQKEYILREELAAINEELDGGTLSEAEELTEEVAKLDAPQYVKDKLNKEIKRLKNLSGNNSEANVERTYIETCLDLPWNVKTQDNRDIDNARRILDADHYGMKEIKDRIIEALAVRNITSTGKAPIICLVGPPGTGKTSIAKSVARALGKSYVRICLGGVRDEAEIRGHRKTYIGAMPGRIIDGLKQAKANNPLMLLDEIDKISSDYKGDTSAALLEVLDSEQNVNFVDHYIEMPVDLSNVLFIATANDLSKISRPLLDRMEVIEVSSYTSNEKFHIAREHLIRKQMQENGLSAGDVKFSDKAVRMMIDSYTREAGVRGLERQIAKAVRKAVGNLYKEGVFAADGTRNKDVKKTVNISEKNISDYLGKVKYRPDKKNSKGEVGIVRGLAWTQAGGDTLEIEVLAIPGKGEFKLTGNMGDVMKESAQIAVSYVKSVTESGKYKVNRDFYENHVFHLHIPEGATPKDGPSAGITMATAILSAVTKRPVRADISMTGELTLRGRILPIGGIKEKILASKTAGIKTVFVPKENQPDVEELDQEIIEDMDIIYVERALDVFEQALI
ncbi:MAG: endopeptidase La [Clostridia bacterium]|nr:endopeptidase La [Clostridia bacterium]